MAEIRLPDLPILPLTHRRDYTGYDPKDPGAPIGDMPCHSFSFHRLSRTRYSQAHQPQRSEVVTRRHVGYNPADRLQPSTPNNRFSECLIFVQAERIVYILRIYSICLRFRKTRVYHMVIL